MRGFMEKENTQSKPYSYHLPPDVIDWIKEQAAKDNRSASNYLTTLIRRIRDSVVAQ